jgi:hypothetical protein
VTTLQARDRFRADDSKARVYRLSWISPALDQLLGRQSRSLRLEKRALMARVPVSLVLLTNLRFCGRHYHLPLASQK